MPRNVRNFWIELEVDGAKREIADGPVAKDGGFTMHIRQRDEGSVTLAAVVRGYEHEGQLRLTVETNKAGVDVLNETKR